MTLDQPERLSRLGSWINGLVQVGVSDRKLRASLHWDADGDDPYSPAE